MHKSTNPYPTSGNLGLGINSANFNLQVHGTSDHIILTPAVYDRNGNLISPEQNVNYGKTSRIGLTNTNTGFTNKDGLQFRMSALNGAIENLEEGNLSLSSAGARITFSGASDRVWFAAQGNVPTEGKYGYANIITTDNGLYIKNNIGGKYGISIEPKNATDNALQVFGTDLSRNFSVQANGHVYARKYTTTLNNIPDYVFDSGYYLMPLSELRNFIQKNSHLPNIPSAKEFEKTGVDLGELNRLLLEKVEELTLYILQLEERINTIEQD